MYHSHPDFNEPEDENTKIWRYMDFPKFCSLLYKKALYFADIDSFDDRLEGSYPLNQDQQRPKILLPHDRKWTKACCFHMNKYESQALWKLDSQKNGLAIQTTYGKLKKSFDKCEYEVHLGKIDYIDFRKEGKDTIRTDNKFPVYLTKDKSLDYERELRAIVWQLSEIGKKLDVIPLSELTRGLYVPIDINFLIEKIYLSPQSPDWYKSVVEDVTKKYGYDLEVINSSLDESPKY